MRSLTKLHKQKCLDKQAASEIKTAAKKAVRQTEPTGLAEESFDVVLAQFERHREQLKALESIDDKVAFKKNIVGDYVTYLTRYLNSKQQYANPVLSRIVFWLIDIDDINNAYTFGKLAIQQQQIAPDGFKRDLTTAFAETLFEWCERQFKAGLSAEPFLTDLCTHCLNDEWIISEVIVLNKIFKLRALYAEKEKDWQKAVTYFEHCVAVNPEKHGVKIKLNNARTQLNSTGSA